MTFERRLVIPAAMTRMIPIEKYDTDYCVSNSFEGALSHRVIVNSPSDYILHSGSFWLGTGGSLHSGLRFEDPRFWGANVQELRPRGVVPLATVGEMLGAIKRYLWLTLVDIARVLRVQRPTVYAWLEGTQQPRDSNAQRLSVVFAVAERSRETTPTSSGRLDGAERSALLELLTADVIDEGKCRILMERVTARSAPISRPRLATTGSSAKSTAMQDASRERAIRRFGGRKRG